MKIKNITPITFGSIYAKYKNDDGTFFFQPVIGMAVLEERSFGGKYDVIHPVVAWQEDGFEVEDGETGNYCGLEYKDLN